MKATFDEKNGRVEILFTEAQQKEYLPYSLYEYLMEGGVFGLDCYDFADRLVITATNKDEYINILEIVLQGIGYLSES